jgi:hypothetical protein
MGVVPRSVFPDVEAETSPVDTVTDMYRFGDSLPGDWVPRDTLVEVYAFENGKAHRWEAIIPRFTIAGMGDDADAAIVNALELLEDYLLLSAQEGKSYAESYRGIGWREFVASIADVGRLFMRAKLGRHAGRGYRHERRPLAPAH